MAFLGYYGLPVIAPQMYPLKNHEWMNSGGDDELKTKNDVRLFHFSMEIDYLLR